ncbi:hypothetical protein ASPWEDRAFT_109538 [Aspergillus wentii DTO 134E9]|uniref:ABC transporter domain-containing protein n=1 Tax=Aspergillus wentii DTO 134E9 TaxID=1073089 RepID=A0A1L9RMH2_ASPWE|nr:uncharacterized protein ASPWEDRAFT_109538 [Aspergillus wentii DTO 134E9]OJJ36083.1 hypothetical protein ASPWEDRAFT_109538 [Aspergillus wentii DTO 134E9]
MKIASSLTDILLKPISYERKNKESSKCILDDISLQIPKGCLTIIIGPSGGGKTTLLDIISRRLDRRSAQIEGDVFVDDGCNTAYVTQKDYLLPSLTVKETLRYTADLKLPLAHPCERTRVTEQLIVQLGLANCANTQIRRCSGGEVRRTSLGVQLLSNPSYLLCDEPTTGLDATRAYDVMKILHQLVRNGRTVVASIHTPRAEIWNLADHVVMLSQGSVLYSGGVDAVRSYFASIGFEIPFHPAEYLVDLMAVDYRSTAAKARSSERIQRLTECWKSQSPRKDEPVLSVTPSPVTPSQPGSLPHQVRVLTRRTIKTSLRDPIGVFSSLALTTTVSLITGYIFFQLDGGLQAIRSRQSALFVVTALNNGYLILMYEVFRLSIDIQSFDRERREGAVTVLGYVISRRAAKALIEDIPGCFISCAIFYFMVGFQPQASRFFIFVLIVLLLYYTTLALSLVCIAIDRRFPVATIAANLAITLQLVACGNFVQLDQIPVYTRWLKWIDPQFYGFGALLANEFTGPNPSPYGQLYDCPYSSDPADPRCKEYTGVFIMDRLGFPRNWIWKPVVVLIGFIVGLYVVAVLLLHYKRPNATTAQNSSSSSVDGGEIELLPSGSDQPDVTIQVQDYSLAILKRFRKSHSRAILQSLSTTFHPGQLNIIMGPSGSGKSTLLNAITGRIHSSFNTRNKTTGDILYNGTRCSAKDMQAISSYVLQTDYSLYPFLTVRETLYHAARLRLPGRISTKDAQNKADQILQQMGLQNCADSLVGDDTFRGISGGEMRRLSIAIQLLHDPRVLVLDEPTSGLDAFSSATIFDILAALAKEGRTIILSVHQPRSDLYRHFSNVLLLGHAGSVLYTGPGETLLHHLTQYYGGQTNPADLIMDIISGDAPHAFPHIPQPEVKASSLDSQKKQQKPLRIILPTILHRAFIGMYRRPYLVGFHLAGPIGVGIIITLFFAPLKHDYAAVQTILGLSQEFCVLYFLGMIQNTSTYPIQQKAFDDELIDRCITPEAFVLEYTLTKLPLELLSSILFGALVTAVGLTPAGKMVFISAFTAFVIINCGESIGIIMYTCISHTGLALCLISLMGFIAYTLGGVMNPTPPVVFQAFNHLSPVKYATATMTEYMLAGRRFSCANSERLDGGSCPVSEGEEVLRLYKMDGDPSYNLIGLAVCLVAYRVAAYVAVKIRAYFV